MFKIYRTSLMLSLALTGFAVLFWLMGTSAYALPGILFVAPDGSGAACTQAQPCALSTALDQAHDGDTLYLAQGTYTGVGPAVITVNKSIGLYGGWDGAPVGPIVRDPDAYPTVLDGEDERQVIYLAGGPIHPITVTLSGLTVVHGNGSHAAFEPGYGGGIFGFYATPIITGNVIAYNVASTDDRQGIGGGIAIKVSPGPARIEANRVFSNVASLRSKGVGGGIRLLNAPGAQVINNVVMSNTAAISATRGYGGGIAIEGHSENSLVQGNQVAFNVALRRGNGTRGSQGYGGGIDVTSDAVTLSHNEVLSNTAVITGGSGSGGGIAVMGADHVVLESNQVAHNLAQQDAVTIPSNRGGGIYCFFGDDILIRGNTVRYNTTSVSNTGSGGGVHLDTCQQAVIQGNLIEGNRASVHGSGYGGGFHAYASRGLRVEANRVISNMAASSSFWGKGGGLYFSRRTAFTMTNNIVARNHASKQGGGVAFETSATEPVTGALIHNTFVANNRGRGEGRIAIHLNEPYVTLALTNTLIVSHTYGIYVHSDSTVTLQKTLFYANSEGDTGGPGAITNLAPITGRDPLLDGDDHLQVGSPAIDAGVNAGVTTDIDGDPRPVGPAPDIGADEYSSRIYRFWLPMAF